MQGLILSGSKNVFEVECTDGVIRECPFKGKILKSGEGYYNPIAPGDIVQLEDSTLEEKKALITELVPRKNEFVRFNIKKKQPQLLAANLDFLFIVTTPDEPPFRPRFVDRALAQAEYQQIQGVIVCNKYDLKDSAPQNFKEQLKAWKDTGYKVLCVSAKTGEGLSELAKLLEGHLSAFVGQSGVGKSSLINAIDSNADLKTGSLSQKYGRGTHTTTQGTLMHLSLKSEITGTSNATKADIIDTPGVRRFLLHDITAQNLHLYFKEFTPFIGKCGFGMSCSHIHESNCAVKKAVEDHAISELRYDSWLRICEELKSGTFED